MKRFDAYVDFDHWSGTSAEMEEHTEGCYVEYEEVCSFLKELLNCDLATLIERIEEEIKNA